MKNRDLIKPDTETAVAEGEVERNLIAQLDDKDFLQQFIKLDDTLEVLDAQSGVLLMSSYLGLRYALRHTAMSARQIMGGESLDTNYLNKASEELMRAKHDAIEAVITFAHYEMLLIEEEYSEGDIIQVFPDYFLFREEMDRVNLELNSPDSSIKDRDLKIERLRTSYLPRLLNHHKRLVTGEKHALKKMRDTALAEKKKMYIFGVGGMLIGAAGVLATVVTFLILS